MKRDVERTGVFTRRALLLMGGQLAVLGTLGARLYQVQVREGARYTTLADENLHPSGAPLDTMAFHGHLPEGLTAGTYDCSGVRWGLLPKVVPDGYKAGDIIRVFKAEWVVGK